MKRLAVLILLASATASLSAQTPGRWFSEDQVSRGKALFEQNCAACHGQNAEATENWKQTDSNGKYPPPPLNGSAHTWHHDLDTLRRTIREGGIPLGGVMPGFANTLNDEQVNQVIAFFQSKWPEDIYQKWSNRFVKSELPVISASPQNPEKEITRYLSERVGNAPLPPATQTVIDGVWEIKLQNRYLYLTEGGKFAFIGDLVDLQTGTNLTENSRKRQTIDALTGFADEDLVIFEPAGKTLATLSVFTDTSCAYCQKLHQEVPMLNDAGIRVRYLPFPRGGQRGPGYATLKSVWCAEDRNQAITDAKNNETGDLPPGDCEAAATVDQGYRTGVQVGISGTPALFKENGEKIEGYVPYQELIPMVLNR